MLDHVALEKILFLDIETVCQFASYDEVPAVYQELWSKKSQRIDSEADPQTSYEKAALYAEFGKIICVSVGFIASPGGQRIFRVTSFYGDDEKELLQDFASLLDKRFASSGFYLCAHNGKSFDFPYLSRRMLINGIKIPYLLETAGRKPWEVAHIDTMEIWRFGDWKATAGLHLLATIFNIPTPKDDIDGSQVNHTYWREKNLARIEEYCRKDVLTVAQLFLRFRRQTLIDPADVVVV